MCHGQAKHPLGRWSKAACAYCCMWDISGDGFLTEAEMMQHYHNACGDDEEQQQGTHMFVYGGLCNCDAKRSFHSVMSFNGL